MPENRNHTQTDYSPLCIHQLFEAQVERTPDAIAVVFENQQLSYLALNARANQLAHYLKTLGVGPDVLVGLCVERSLDMIVGLLGILKAGGAYVPLEPAYPKERLAFMLSDAQVPVLLTQKKWQPQVSEQVAARVISLDSDGEKFSQESEENVVSGVTTENLAYVIYTSGSTGTPKGVEIEHCSVFNLSNALYQAIYKKNQPEQVCFPKSQVLPAPNRSDGVANPVQHNGNGMSYGVANPAQHNGNGMLYGVANLVQPKARHQNSQLRVSLNGSLAFDTSVKQIIQLFYGHTLDIIPESIRLDGSALLDYLTNHQIDVFDCTPSQLGLLISAGLLSQTVSTPKTVLIGGEPINESTWQALAPVENIRFYNVYGPTECTVDATVCEVRTSVKPIIGCPLANVQISILDQQHQPILVGESGELHIGGVCLARGYRNRPELTAEKFIPNPFSKEPDARFYKTGDLARYLPDGNIEFLGRIDSQVKLRGYRIELGEIETALAQHPDVQQAVVLMREEVAGDKRLVSYVVPKPSRAPTIAGKPRYSLPNNLAIAHLNKNETDFLYQEIFEVGAYLKHGITIKDGDCIFDVGTNIGLFSLFAHFSGKNVKIYGFEPNPFVFELLGLNTALYEVDAKLFNCGLSSKTTTANFTFYPKFSFLSGLYADTADEKEIVKSFLLNQQQKGETEVASLAQNNELLKELLADKFNSETFEVPLKTLSAIIKENHIEHIDLLKINVEKSEWDVLAGIDEADWPKIHQIALEVHDIDGRLEQVLTLFEKHGYNTEVERDWSFDETVKTNYYLYAIQGSRQDLKVRQPANNKTVDHAFAKLSEPILTANELRDFLKKRLPDYMVPSAFVMLERLPLTPNGKIDRQALPALFQTQWNQADYVAPNTPTEELLAALWADVLGLEQVGTHDNFFELGGHSLHATQIISRVREAFQSDVPISALFDNPTVAKLAARIEANIGKPDEENKGGRGLEANAGKQYEKSECQNNTGYPLKPRHFVISLIREILRNLLTKSNISRFRSLLQHFWIAKTGKVGSHSTQPLSINQQSFWLFEQLYPNTPTYNIPLAYQLTGMLNLLALEQALSETARRHATLRTLFEIDEKTGKPQQRIAPPSPVTVTVTDIGDLSDTEIKQAINEEIRRPFNLAQDCLLRVTVLRLQEQKQILLLTFHHLITDGCSIGIFIHELMALYAALSEDALPRVAEGIPKLSLGTRMYVDFCQWQQQWLQSEQCHSQLAYWQSQLHTSTMLELPSDYPRPPVQTYQGARQLIVISPALTKALHNFSHQQGVTLFMTLLAAFKTLLYRYTGQTDLSIGTAIAGRQRVEWENVMGLFTNVLVLRTHLSGQTSFVFFLEQVRKVALAAYTHQDLPFQSLVDSVHPARDLSYHPLFQTFFLLQNFDFPRLNLSGLTTTPLEVSTGTAKFDLTLELYEKADGLTGWFEYNTALFSAATMQRMVGHFQTVLESIVAMPETQLSTLHLLTEAERNQLCRSDTNARPSNSFIEFTKIEQSISERFEQQVRKYPHNIAVKTTHEELTYLELNQRVLQVAHTLLKQCVGFEKNIGLLFEHDASMIVGILGVLKAGLTYVPLAPDLPVKRLVYTLEDSQASVILTNHKLLALAQELTHDVLPLINIDERESVESDDIRLSVSPDTVAYILYTSGSTGQPKGVIQNHRHVLHFIRTYTNNLHINADDKLTLLSAYSFDAAVMDIFGALLNGATLYPINIKEDSLANPVKEFIKEQEITIYHSTSTVYRHFISTLTKDDHFPQLRLIVLGGEEVHKSDVDLYQQNFSDNCLFINGLGPTESTVTLQYFINKQTSNFQQTVPVGYPVDETEILLLNEAGEETEFYGEIAIKSAYVALGYWQKPKITQAAFQSVGNQRLYRTGDMGRLRVDGSLEFVGRKDAQVKLRGYRIELGEIEAILKQHSAIQESAVVVRKKNHKLKQLVAYIVPFYRKVEGISIPTPTADELRRFLKEKLPDYMVPTAFVMLEAIPLLPNGKLNRQKLPVPEIDPATYSAPRNPLEFQLANIWQKVLGIESIGIHDNFFDLGGHSLLAVTLLSRIEKRFDKHLPLITLFQAPTIAQLTAILKEEGVSDRRMLVVIQSQGTCSPFFFIGSTNYARALVPVLGNNQPVYGLNIFGLQPSDSTIPSLNVKDIARQYCQEIRTVQPSGPYYLGGYCADAKIALEIAQQFQADGEKIALLAFIDVIWQPQNRYFSIHRHWHNFLAMGFSYISHKVSQKFKYIKTLLKLSFSQFVSRFYRHTRKQSPRQLQNLQFINSFYAALNNYEPQPYFGHITLFLSSDWRLKHSTALSQLAMGGLKVYEVAGYHDNLFVAPQVDTLGRQLKRCLEEADKQ